jgi:hypothetical protein
MKFEAQHKRKRHHRRDNDLDAAPIKKKYVFGRWAVMKSDNQTASYVHVHNPDLFLLTFAVNVLGRYYDIEEPPFVGKVRINSSITQQHST